MTACHLGVGIKYIFSHFLIFSFSHFLIFSFSHFLRLQCLKDGFYLLNRFLHDSPLKVLNLEFSETDFHLFLKQLDPLKVNYKSKERDALYNEDSSSDSGSDGSDSDFGPVEDGSDVEEK